MNTLFLITLVVEAVFAVGFLAAPGPMLKPFGVAPDADAATFVRLFGSALLGFPVLLWFARRSDSPQFKRGALCTLATYYLVSLGPLLMAQIGGRMNPLGWSVVAMHAALLLAYGYFLARWPGGAG